MHACRAGIETTEHFLLNLFHCYFLSSQTSEPLSSHQNIDSLGNELSLCTSQIVFYYLWSDFVGFPEFCKANIFEFQIDMS